MTAAKPNKPLHVCGWCGVSGVAVEEVLDKHLTSDRWSVDPEDADYRGGVRDHLAFLLHTSMHNDGSLASVEADFLDLRDYFLWQAVLDGLREF